MFSIVTIKHLSQTQVEFTGLSDKISVLWHHKYVTTSKPKNLVVNVKSFFLGLNRIDDFRVVLLK